MTTDKPVADDALPEPAGYFYEFDSPLGLHRSFRHARYNGYEPDRSVAYYTTDQMRAAIARERERIARMLDAEHEKRKHADNHAAFYARMIRDAAIAAGAQK